MQNCAGGINEPGLGDPRAASTSDPALCPLMRRVPVLSLESSNAPVPALQAPLGGIVDPRLRHLGIAPSEGNSPSRV